MAAYCLIEAGRNDRSTHGRRRVLDQRISEYLSGMLRDAGYDVIAVANADDAIAVLELRNDIRLVITDINMPGSMDGLKLAAAVKGRWPPINIIIVTGKGRPRDDQMPAEAQFLPKPYMRKQVLAAVLRHVKRHVRNPHKAGPPGALQHEILDLPDPRVDGQSLLLRLDGDDLVRPEGLACEIAIPS